MERVVSASAASLLPLREDLHLHEAAPDREGAPTWSIQDPVTNRFFQIGWLEYECLLRWSGASGGSAAAIAQDIARHTPLDADEEQVLEFARFLERHQLLRPSPEGIRKLVAQANQPGWQHWRWWLHHYLFIRIPLVRPQRWLAALLPYVRPLVSPLGLGLILSASLLGIVLVARQWDVFANGVMDILTPAGIAGFLLALVISKTFHELGHALVSTHYGVRVAHMGVALVVLWPMLYTDTSESWKLHSSRQRLRISAAGIAVEMALAGLATLAWALLGDGPLRQAMLYLATTGWLLSLALNASPFMRFDGYFIASDLLDFPNLHERSGAVARAWLRRCLLGWPEPEPEPLAPGQRRALVAFALATWLYRLVVFVGIAVAVYVMFFKLLGIFLFAVEIVWFVLRPMTTELSVWFKRRQEISVRHRRIWLLLGLAGMGVLLVPWAFDISAPGVTHTRRLQNVFSPFPARLTALHAPGPVKAGEVLAHFESPDLNVREAGTAALARSFDQRLLGLTAEDDGKDRQQATNQRLGEQLAQARGIQDEVGRLRVAAEFDGVWRDVDPTLAPGVWVGIKEPLGVLMDPTTWVADVYVEQSQVARIRVGAQASFWPEKRLTAIRATVTDIDTTRSSRLSHPMLDAQHGGPIATQPGDRQGHPVKALYRVRLALAEPPDVNHEAAGRATIDGTRISLLWEGTQQALAVVIRESGF